jgi:L-alanine-DL-glutamate epimerase-like enolase superfamily enzyme
MRRREFLSWTGAAAAGVALGISEQSTKAAPTAKGGSSATGSASLTGESVRLKLRHTWTTVMSSSDYRDTFHVRYTRDGLTGRGEGAPIQRYHETAASALTALEGARSLLEKGDPWQHVELMAQLFTRVPGEFAMKAAVDAALLDWLGQRLGIPLYRYLGLDPKRAPITTMSIGIDTPELTKKKVAEAAEFPVLKIKVGLDSDEATLAAVRSVTNKPLRVDANEGWKSKEEAARKINWLQSLGVEFIEQPLPVAMHEETRWLRTKVHMPIFADEACLHLQDIPKLAQAYDGINIKLDKCGGIWEALRMIHTARAHGMKVMLGCMISSSAAIAAAAHLSPLVDYADLDGSLLISNDPFQGVTVEKGQLILPNRPGLGIVPATP